MYTLLAAAALAASMGGQGLDGAHHRCYPGFAPNVDNGLLATPAPEDETRVYTPGFSEYSGRLWVGDDVKDIRSRRATRENPGRLAYGAADAGHERVKLKVGFVVVSVSPWQKVEGEGWANFERGRQQWLAERGYTGGVRTFVHPARLRAMQAQEQAAPGARSDAERRDGPPDPSATIRLRRPHETPGIIKKVDAGVAGGLKIVSGDTPVRISWPMTARAEVVERAVARGWTESEEAEKQVADARE